MQMQGALRRGQEWPGNPRGTVENSRQQVCREKRLALPLPLTQHGALRPNPSQFPPGYSRLLLRACRGHETGRPRSLYSYYPQLFGKGGASPLPDTVPFLPSQSLYLPFLAHEHERGTLII